MFRLKDRLLIGYIFFTFVCIVCCDRKVEKRTSDRRSDYIREIPGTNDTIPTQVIEQGKVLISYSDCNTCHKEDERSFGPAFKDIAKRYPTNKVYINMLAQKVIIGGSRSWGYPVMMPHPKLSPEEARIMVSYILSLDQ